MNFSTHSNRSLATEATRVPFDHNRLRGSQLAGLLLLLIATGGAGCVPPESAVPVVVPPGGQPADQVQGGDETVVTADALRDQIDRTLAATLQNRQLNTDDHGAWQILHGALTYRQGFPVRIGRTGPFSPALEYAMSGGRIQGWTYQPGDILDRTTNRRGLRAIVEPGTRKGQGHADQWLAILAQAQLPLEQPLKLGGADFELRDFLEQVQR
ncbi:MAG: hypothetical protein KDB23_33425, partial [Planctomycetales bacterium]|nr:hypothetical protein [Planctomycetales bacterium]